MGTRIQLVVVSVDEVQLSRNSFSVFGTKSHLEVVGSPSWVVANPRTEFIEGPSFEEDGVEVFDFHELVLPDSLVKVEALLVESEPVSHLFLFPNSVSPEQEVPRILTPILP